MTKEQQLLSNEPVPTWHVYIVSCNDKSYYTGITTDPYRRIEEHNSLRKGARYTRSRRPVTLVYSEKAASRAVATRRENEIKKLTPAGKKQLITTYRPGTSRSVSGKPETHPFLSSEGSGK
ncbi:hypothetical protein JCM39068_35010 [Desulfocastanea catecholica]